MTTLSVVLLLSSGLLTAQTAPWLTGWEYRKLITLNKTVSNGFQVLLNVTYDSDMQSDFDDLRFTNYAEDTELDYWIEYKVDGSYADVWVEMENSDKLYMYYDNDGVSTTSDCGSVMEICDTFDRADNMTVGNGWTESSGAFSINSNRLNGIGDGIGADDVYKSYGTFSGLYTYVVKFGYKPSTNGRSAFGYSKAMTTPQLGWNLAETGYIQYLDDEGWHNYDTYSASTWYILRLDIDTSSNSGDYYVNGVSVASDCGYYYDSTDPTIWDMYFYYSYPTAYTDYVYIREYISTMPSADFGSEESQNSAPVLVSRELYPASPTDGDDLALNMKCSDTDTGDTLTAYWTCYKNGVEQGSYTGSMTVTNNVDTQVETISNTDTAPGEQWQCSVYCGDGKTNTATASTSVRTIGGGCSIGADCSQCTGWVYVTTLQVRDSNGNGKLDQICCNGIVEAITPL